MRRKAKTTKRTTAPKRFPADATHRIHWISKITGFSGHGSWISLEAASDGAAYANREWREIEHWVETRGRDEDNSRILKAYKELYPRVEAA